MTDILPVDRAIRYFVNAAEPICDVTQVGNHTGVNASLDVVQNEDDNAFLHAVPVDALDPLAAQGTWLEAGDVYADGGRAVLVRQSHARTSDPVDDLVPTLFLVYRADVDGIAWIAGELVTIGTVRTYGGETYRAIQAHVTQFAPQEVPNLWEPFSTGSEWVDSGETVTSLIGSGVIGVSDTAPFTAGDQIRILGIEATVNSVFTPGAPGVLVINPHIAVGGGEMIEILV